VVEQIAEGILIVEPSRVDVLVSDGIVRLDGRVARHSQAKLAEQLAGGVDGVAAVDNYLRSDLDDTMPARRAASLAVSGRRPPLPPGPRPRPTGLARR
jgi:BON domain